jgi:hypothetical protein
MEKNTLWVFGDSFSWDHKIRLEYNKINHKEDQIWDYIQNHLNGEIFDSWGKILSDYLEYDYKNYACGIGVDIPYFEKIGNSNYCMLNSVNEFVNQFKKGDIIFLGFTDICRFKWGSIDINGNEISHIILPSTDIINELSDKKNTIENVLINRHECKFYIYDLLHQLKSLELLSDIVGFKLYYWDWSSYFDNMVYENKLPRDRWIFFNSSIDYKDYGKLIWETYNAGPICWETDFKNKDSHMGKIGNEIHATHLYNYLKTIL